jgi:hypothetical protein
MNSKITYIYFFNIITKTISKSIVMPLDPSVKLSAANKLKKVVLQARYKHEKKLNPNYVIAELTAKGFGLGLWYGLVFVAIHYLVSTIKAGTLEHLFVAENGYLFLLGLSGLTVFGFGCGLSARIWNYMFPAHILQEHQQQDNKHIEDILPIRIFNLAVVTLRFLPKVMHYLKAHSHVLGNEEVTVSLDDVEAVLEGFSGHPMTPRSLKGDKDVEAREQEVLLGLRAERASVGDIFSASRSRASYGATEDSTMVYLSSGPKRCTLFAHGKSPLSPDEVANGVQEYGHDESCDCTPFSL